jgi:isopenicillin N synthase-like dioxygenase
MSETTSAIGPEMNSAVDLSARPSAFDSIPIIDFAPMLGNDPAAKRAVAASMRAACESAGFFYVSNHGVATELVEEIFAVGRKFFDLPIDRKLAIHKSQSPHHSGYTPLLAENTDPTNNGDLHECYDMVIDMARTQTTQGRGGELNLWPVGLPEFRDRLSLYFDQVLALGHRLFEALAISLDLSPKHFEPYLTSPTAMLRINYYPPQPAQTEGVQMGIGAHTDYECFTILAQQNDVCALQVWNGREWVQAPPVPGTFVVNIADLMQRWTNDSFRSTRHRAINTSGAPRISIPFFLGVNYETEIVPLPCCVDDEHPSRYPRVVAGDYLFERLDATYGIAPKSATD